MLKLFVGLVVLMVLGIGGLVAVHWAPDRSVEQLSGRWAKQPSQFVKVTGMSVHLRDEGPKTDPVPIVLLHGTSASLHTWDGWAQSLRKTRRVIRFDLPGFGLTGPSINDDYRMAAYVTFVKQVLDSLQIDKCILVGNSLGGSIAWSTTAAYPDLVDKLTLVDSGGYPVVPKSIPLAFKVSQIPVLNKLVKVVLPRSAVESSVRNVYGDPEKVTPELVDRYFELTLREGNRGVLKKRFSQLKYTDQSEIVQSIQQPTLILWGAKDELIPIEVAKRFHGDLPNSELVVFETLGHVPHEEDPVNTLAEFERFIGSI